MEDQKGKGVVFFASTIYRAINRGNRRAGLLFDKPADYEAFLRLLGEGLEKHPLEVLAFTLMPNHWHLVLRPAKDGQMGRLPGWMMRVNKPLTSSELKSIRECFKRNRLFGSEEWTEEIADRHGLWSSLHPIGRLRTKIESEVNE